MTDYIDRGLRGKYQSLGLSYDNEYGVGKFVKYCEDNGFDEEGIIGELDPEDKLQCGLTEFDLDFPFNGDEDQRNEYIFDLLYELYQNYLNGQSIGKSNDDTAPDDDTESDDDTDSDDNKMNQLFESEINVRYQSSFPSDRPHGVSPSLFSLLEEQHCNPDMRQAMQMMKDLGPDHYDKHKSGLHYAWYAYPTRKPGGSDMANTPTKIQNEQELKQALNPSLIGEDFRAKRAADIKKWIYFITFTADALKVGSAKVLNVGPDRRRLHKFVIEMSEYGMLKKGAAAATLSSEQRAFRDAFLRLRAVMQQERLMNRNNRFYK